MCVSSTFSKMFIGLCFLCKNQPTEIQPQCVVMHQCLLIRKTSFSACPSGCVCMCVFACVCIYVCLCVHVFTHWEQLIEWQVCLSVSWFSEFSSPRHLLCGDKRKQPTYSLLHVCKRSRDWLSHVYSHVRLVLEGFDPCELHSSALAESDEIFSGRKPST